MILIYDGSFEGFLSLVYEVYYQKIKVSKIHKTYIETLFIDEIKTIKTDEEKALKVLNALKEKFPKKAYETIFNVFLCDKIDFEMQLLKFIIIGFKEQKELFNLNNDFVLELKAYEKELFYTVHKMYGFTRFVELEDGTLYAKIQTKHNVLYFLGKHFLKRLNNQNFIIHDINRKLAFIKNEDISQIENISSYEEPKESLNEEHFKSLWCEFFSSVTIKQRENKKAQRGFVPLLFRSYMTEFN